MNAVGGINFSVPAQGDAATNPPIISVQDVTIAYPGHASVETIAVRNFSVSIRPGEIVGLIGDAASGKSTAALSLLGIVRAPGRLVSGKVDFQGHNLFSLDAEQLRRIRGRNLSLIVQNPRAALNPVLTIGDQIATVYRTHNKVSRPSAVRHAVDMLRLVGINAPEWRAHAYPHEISGGMAQRVLIAIALSSQPQLLVADEPTSGLDVTIQAQLLDRMWRIVREQRAAVLMVAQDLGVIANYCDRVLVMCDGGVVEEAQVRAFFRGPLHPYSCSILLTRERNSSVAAPAPAAPLIQVRALSKRFRLGGSRSYLQAISDVSLEIGKGQTLGLVGESGSGKSTVGRCLLGLVKGDSGTLAHHSGKVVDLRCDFPRALRANMQIVFQDPLDTLSPRWKGKDLLAEPLRLYRRMSGSALAERSAELLNLVGLRQELANAYPRSLSAGEQQRLGIARALANEPEMIVLDEPTSALAPAARVAITRLLAELQSRLGLSYLFISHDLTTVSHLSHRIAVMYLGQIVEAGTREQVFSTPRHPYTHALLAAHLDTNPVRRRPEHPPAIRLEGEIPSPIDLPRGCYLAGRCPAVLPRCKEEMQILRPLGERHLVRCWRAAEPDGLNLA